MAGVTQDKQRVLVVAHTTTFLTELSLFGQLIRTRTDAEVIFYCAFQHWTADEFARSCATDGIACLLEPIGEGLARLEMNCSTRANPGSGAGSDGTGVWPRMLERAIAALPTVGASFDAERRAFAARRRDIEALLGAVQPRLLVLGGEMPGYDTGIFVKAAHDAGVPVLIVPSTMSNGLEQAEVYYGDPSYHVRGVVRNLIAALFPRWVRRHKDRRLFRCPPGRVLAMELAGIAPPLPWIFNSGHADAVAMESEAMIDYYVESGLGRDRMVLTGALSDDVMTSRLQHARGLREELCRPLGLDPDFPMFLTALPPDFLYVTGGRPQCDFDDYRQLVLFWIDSLADLTGCSCLVALHPSVDVESMRWIERPNVRIAPGRTASLVPLCDVYVASISSTIRWAIACAKPVVNYDVYRYRYTDFLGLKGVLATEERGEFRELLQRLAGDASYRAQVAEEQKRSAARWGLLDGKVGDRMLAVVARLSGIGAGHGRPRGSENESAPGQMV
ncbi:hypothetical protein [Pseudorhodoplanes sp.]|uniref:hypothetical protein n=1 Tax=Pseudorhodoplanes sp. TaxID=1934341 RepID=UPI003D12895F